MKLRPQMQNRTEKDSAIRASRYAFSQRIMNADCLEFEIHWFYLRCFRISSVFIRFFNQ